MDIDYDVGQGRELERDGKPVSTRRVEFIARFGGRKVGGVAYECSPEDGHILFAEGMGMTMKRVAPEPGDPADKGR